MSEFTSELQYRKHLEYTGMYVITKSFKFYWSDGKTGPYVEIPVGALTNFASIPKFLRWLWEPDGDGVKMASTIHDLMIGEFGIKVPIMKDGEVLRYATWEEAALWFRAALRVRGCPGYRRQLFYRAVLLNGALRRID